MRHLARVQAVASSDQDPGPAGAAPALPDLDLAFDRFADYARVAWNHSDATIRGYRDGYRNFRHFLLSADGLTIPEEIRAFSIDAWTQWNRRRRATAVTTRFYWRAVKAFFRYLHLVEGMHDPFAGLPMPKAGATLPKARSADECRRILAAARNYPWPDAFLRTRAVAMLAVMIFAGLRKREVLRLEFADVDLQRGTMRVVRGKGRFGGKDRTAYVPGELSEVLKAYLAERSRRQLTGPEFFLSARSGRGLSESQLIRLVRLIRRASGVPFSMHSLRHSFVTRLLQLGTPIHVARDLAGHEDIETTARYLRVFDEEKEHHIRRFRLD